MKRTLLLNVLFCAFLLSLLIGCASSDTSSEEYEDVIEDTQIAGGFTDFREPDADELALFELVIKNNTDGSVQYTPDSIQTQVVAGVNYTFSALAKPQDGTKSYDVYVLIYQPLSGDPELTDIILHDGTSVQY